MWLMRRIGTSKTINSVAYAIAILVLMSLTTPSSAFWGFMTDNVNKAKVKTSCINLKTIKNTLDLYRLDKLKYPSDEEGLDSLIQEKLIKEEKYLMDPWGTPYQYKNKDDQVLLSSLGADKKVGGEGFDADITLESCLANSKNNK